MYSRTVIDIPLDDDRADALEISLDRKTRLCVAFEASAFMPNASGSVTCRFSTPLAQDFVERLEISAAARRRAQDVDAPAPR